MKNEILEKIINQGYHNMHSVSFNDDHHYGVLGKPIEKKMYNFKEDSHISSIHTIVETIDFFKNNIK